MFFFQKSDKELRVLNSTLNHLKVKCLFFILVEYEHFVTLGENGYLSLSAGPRPSFRF